MPKCHTTVENAPSPLTGNSGLGWDDSNIMSQNNYIVILFGSVAIMEFLTEKELLAILTTAKKESNRDFAMILVSYKHALRASETASLTLGDLKDGCLDVKRKKGSLHTIQTLMPHKGEPLLDEVKALRAWLKVRPDDGSKALFTSQKGGALSREQVHRIFKRSEEHTSELQSL